MALLYLLGRAEVDIAAIMVSGTGEVRCGPGAEIALSELEDLGPEANIRSSRSFDEQPKEAHGYPTGYSMIDRCLTGSFATWAHPILELLILSGTLANRD